MAMRVKVLFFGQLREIVGRPEDDVEIGEDEHLGALFARYGAKHPEALRLRGSLVAAINQEFAPWEARLRPGDEVAFLPPVSGG
jgi:sulfur-carrier protein